MLPIHSKPVAVAMPETIVDNAAVTTTEVDTLGFDYASFYMYIGTTDIALTDLVVQETDTAGSNYTDVTPTDFTSTSQVDVEGTALALPTAGADGTWRVIHISLVGRKRYLDLDITVGDGTAGGWYFAFCILSRAKAQPMTNAGLAGTSGICVVC